MNGGVLIVIGGAVAAFLLSEGIGASRNALRMRLQQLESAHGKRENFIQLLGAVIDPWVQRLAISQRLDRELAKIGIPWTPGEFFLVSALCSLASAAMALLLSRNAWVALALGLGGSWIPFAWLGQRLKARHKALSRQLPDAIMLMINALRAGNNFLQTLHLVGRQLPHPMGEEFKITVKEINWGVSMETALAGLQQRTDMIDMELIVTAVLIQRETGGNLSGILSNIHEAIRERLRISGEVQSMTAQGRLSGGLLSAMPLLLLLAFYLISPAYIEMLFTPAGRILLGGTAVMEILGILLMRKMVEVRY